jgi:tetratricopeptide (TPR) repeat protein/energy-coupling factor transporter ATP-binding protein EcfA2
MSRVGGLWYCFIDPLLWKIIAQENAMPDNPIFVGRRAELEKFDEVLTSPEGAAVVVVGPPGMGKTALLDKMAECALNHPSLKCGSVRYEVTPTESPESVMALMIDNIYEAAAKKEGSFAKTDRNWQQWKVLLNAFKHFGLALGDLVENFKRDPAKHTREQFLEKMCYISGRMPENGRAVFVIDPEKYMSADSDQSWAIVVRDLPEKIKFVFAQRPEDVLVGSETFNACSNVFRIPEESLVELDKKSVEEFIEARIGDTPYPCDELLTAVGRYNGHPYAIAAAFDMLRDGMVLDDLPHDPEDIAKKQWEHFKKEYEADAIRLFKAYAILEVGVPRSVVQAVSELNPDTIDALQAKPYLKGLLREEGEGRRIYHALLSGYILRQMTDEEKKEYHRRAITEYKKRLHANEKLNAVAAVRLPEHVLQMNGEEEFVSVFVDESFPVLFHIGLYDDAMSISHRASKFVASDSVEESTLYDIFGIIYQKRDNLEMAEKMHLKALGINEKLNHKIGMSNCCGHLGLLYGRQEKYNEAEKMHKKSLELLEQVESKDEKCYVFMANAYTNIGLIYQMRYKDPVGLKKAIEFYFDALKIYKRLKRSDGIADIYGNIGNVYRICNDLDKAMELYHKSLRINEQLGRQEGIANNYSNLGIVHRLRGEVGEARKYWIKAHYICIEMPMPHMVEKVQDWLNKLDEGGSESTLS